MAAAAPDGDDDPFDGWDDLYERYNTAEIREYVPELLRMILSRVTVYHNTVMVTDLAPDPDGTRYRLATGWQITPDNHVYESNFLVDTVANAVVVWVHRPNLSARSAQHRSRDVGGSPQVNDAACTFIGWMITDEYEDIRSSHWVAGGGDPYVADFGPRLWIPERVLRYRKYTDGEYGAIAPFEDPREEPSPDVVPINPKKKRQKRWYDEHESSPETLAEVPMLPSEKRRKKKRAQRRKVLDLDDSDAVPEWSGPDDDEPPPPFKGFGEDPPPSPGASGIPVAMAMSATTARWVAL